MLDIMQIVLSAALGAAGLAGWFWRKSERRWVDIPRWDPGHYESKVASDTGTDRARIADEGREWASNQIALRDAVKQQMDFGPALAATHRLDVMREEIKAAFR